MPLFRAPRLKGLAVAAVALLGAAAPPAVAVSTSTSSLKLYSAQAPTTAVPVDGTHVADITVTDCGCGSVLSTQPYGSVEIRVPAVAGLSPEGGTVARPLWAVSGTAVPGWTVYRLTNSGRGTKAAVQPGQALVLHVAVPATAVAGAYTLQTQVKQANDFSGTGNDFGLSGDAPVLTLGAAVHHLAWLTQPTSIQSSQTARTPDSIVSMCDAPQVRAEDAANNLVSSFTGTVTLAPAPGTPSGTFTVPPTAFVGGVATFGACTGGITSSTLGHGYRFTASSGGFVTPASNPFDVLTYLASCGATCTTPTLSGDGTTATAGASGGSDSDRKRITFSVDGEQTWPHADDPALDCNPDIGAMSDNVLRDVVTVDVQDRAKTVNLQWSKKAVQAATNNGASQWGICLLAAAPFTGGTAVLTDYFGPTHNGYMGRLKLCGTAGLVATDPCIVKLNKGSGGTQLAQVAIPNTPGDPKLF